MSDIDRYILFTHVAQLENISRAAESLGLSKAAVSKQIKQLENELQVDLFHRQGQRIKLSEHGALLLQQALRLKKELEDTKTLCADFHEEVTGKLHIVAIDFFAREYIYPKLKTFLEQHPKLEIFIDTTEKIRNFDLEQIDIAVGFNIQVPDDIIRRRMLTGRYVMCASKQYFDTYGKPQRLEDLLQHKYIGHIARDEVRDINLKAGDKIRLQPYLILNNITAILEAARQHLGIIQLFEPVVSKYLDNGEFEEVLTEYQATNINFYYYYPKFRYTQPKVRRFIDFFIPVV